MKNFINGNEVVLGETKVKSNYSGIVYTVVGVSSNEELFCEREDEYGEIFTKVFDDSEVTFVGDTAGLEAELEELIYQIREEMCPDNEYQDCGLPTCKDCYIHSVMMLFKKYLKEGVELV